MRIVLASKSPRRRQLLGELFDEFDIITTEVDESLPCSVHPRIGVELLAVKKGEAVARDVGDACMVISADTLVELDGVALGKPADEADACRMLRALSGKGHNVHTGVAVHLGGRVYRGTQSSEVIFRELTDEQIRDYVATGEPMDKAGSYGIQGKGGALVKGYNGDFDNIVGLPLSLTKKLVKEALSDL